MSKTLDIAAIQQFDAEVKHEYTQQGGMIRPTSRLKTGVVGNQHRFPTLGKGTATPRIPQTDVVPMNVQHGNQTATLGDWNAPEFTDIFDQQKTNVDERANLAHTIAGAIGRREDQIQLDAFEAATITNSVSDDVGGVDTNLNTAKVRDAKRQLDINGVPKGADQRYACIHANNLFGLLGDNQATNFDTNAIKALVDGEITKWLGFSFKDIDDRDEGGLPIAAAIRTTYFYHGGMRGAFGFAVGIDFRTEVNYIADKTSWLANGLFSAGSVVIDPVGFVEVSCNETGI